MDEQMTREELEQKIAEVEDEIEGLKAELAEVEEKLKAKAGSEDSSAAQGSGEEQPGEDEETIELRKKEAELFQALAVAQATFVALRKRLNDIISNEAIAEYGQEV